MATAARTLDEQGQALLLEDLQSPCTEEVAVFHAFSRVVNEARSAFVVLDTAPTGHSLLLMDATGAYHRQMMRQYEGSGQRQRTSSRRSCACRTRSMTRVILVTLPEVTPVSQAAALQDDLRRAKIEPWAWVINKSVAATGTTDPLLQARLAGEHPPDRAHCRRAWHAAPLCCPGCPSRRWGWRRWGRWWPRPVNRSAS